jgi:hypothetical protein
MQPLRCSVGVSMREIVEEALKSYELTDRMDPMQVAQSREKVMRYIGSLISAGQRDPLRLTEYARAYLKELHEGPDPRFSGW